MAKQVEKVKVFAAARCRTTDAQAHYGRLIFFADAVRADSLFLCFAGKNPPAIFKNSRLNSNRGGISSEASVFLFCFLFRV